MGIILERLGMTTGKNKSRGWGKYGDGDPRRGTGIPIPVTALIISKEVISQIAHGSERNIGNSTVIVVVAGAVIGGQLR